MSRKTEHNVVRVFYVLVLFGVFAWLVSPFLLSIIFAGTVALTMYPALSWLEGKGMKRKPAAALLTTFFTFVISIPFSFFVIKGTTAVTQQLERFSSEARFEGQGVGSIYEMVRSDLLTTIYRYASKVGLEEFVTMEKLEAYFAQANRFLLLFFQSFATSLPTIFLYFLVMVLCTYSFLKRAQGVRSVVQQTLGLDDPTMDKFVRIFIIDSRQVYITNIVTGGVQSICVAAGASLLGLGDFFLVFFITLILSFIPVIGAAPVAFLMGILGFIRGENTAGFIMLGVGAFTGVIDNVLRPYLATLGSSRLPAMAAFICVIGGALLMGFPGLFIGLLVGSFAWDTLPVFWELLARRPSSSTTGDFLPMPQPPNEESKRH